MTMTPEQIAAAWAMVNAATIGRPVQYHPNYCPEAKGAHCMEWDTSHDLSVIRDDGSRYRIGTFRHAHDAMFDQAARTLVPQLLTALEAERAKVARLVEAATVFAHDVRDLIANSDGVAGLHMNGDMAEWESLLPGGSFSPWLQSIADLESLLTSIKETLHE